MTIFDHFGHDADVSSLHERLAAAANREGVLDIAYRTVDSPVGELLLAATTRGLVRVAYVHVTGLEATLMELADAVSPRMLCAPRRLDVAATQLDEYFARRRTHFDVPLDFQLTRGFRREVVTHLPDIGYGQTASYSEVAAAAGSPRAVRAVGSACANNPLLVVVPCHRVVRSDGSLGQYAGGVAVKSALLHLEGVPA